MPPCMAVKGALHRSKRFGSLEEKRQYPHLKESGPILASGLCYTPTAKRPLILCPSCLHPCRLPPRPIPNDRIDQSACLKKNCMSAVEFYVHPEPRKDDSFQTCLS